MIDPFDNFPFHGKAATASGIIVGKHIKEFSEIGQKLFEKLKKENQFLPVQHQGHSSMMTWGGSAIQNSKPITSEPQLLLPIITEKLSTFYLKVRQYFDFGDLEGEEVPMVEAMFILSCFSKIELQLVSYPYKEVYEVVWAGQRLNFTFRSEFKPYHRRWRISHTKTDIFSKENYNWIRKDGENKLKSIDSEPSLFNHMDQFKVLLLRQAGGDNISTKPEISKGEKRILELHGVKWEKSDVKPVAVKKVAKKRVAAKKTTKNTAAPTPE